MMTPFTETSLRDQLETLLLFLSVLEKQEDASNLHIQKCLYGREENEHNKISFVKFEKQDIVRVKEPL